MRFGVREICNVVFKAAATRTIGSKTFQKGEPVLYFDSLKTSSMEQAVTTVYAQGGRGNARLIAWDGEKTLTFTMEDALISKEGLAILASARLYEPNGSATEDKNKNTLLVHVSEIIIPDGAVSKTPATKAGKGIAFYALELDEHGEIVGAPIAVDIDNATKKISVVAGSDGTIDSTKSYLVDYYTEKTSGAFQIDIEPESFGGNFYIEADTLFRDTVGVDHAAQFVIPNGKIQSNFTLSMASTGDPSTFTFTVDAFPGYVNGDLTKKVLSVIQVLTDDAVFAVDDPAGDKEDSKSYVIVEEET